MRARPSIVFALALACHPQASPPTRDPGSAAPPTPVAAAPEIDEPRMFATLQWLASDDLRGRFTLTDADLGRAAEHISSVYRELGVAPVGPQYRAPFAVVTGSEPGPDLIVWIENADGAAALPESAFASLATGSGTPAFGPVTRLGDRVPKSIPGGVAVSRHDAYDRAALDTRLRAIAKAGATGAILVVPDRPTHPDRFDVAIPVALMSAAEAEARGLSGTAPARASLAPKQVDVTQPSYNVLAYLPGTDLADEIVVLGAHYDHIGTSDAGAFCMGTDAEDSICNGADDNASGTAMVLEIARALVGAGVRPRRSLVFAHFAGEELGLHGSRALAESPPDAVPFSGGRVVAMVNLDMVGRYRDDPGLAIGGIASSDAWMPVLDAAGDHGLSVVYERSVTGRSDHANFFRKKIPVLFFFTGLHDDYHRAGDHSDRINRDGMAKIGRMVLHVTRALADGVPIAWTEPRSPDEGEVGRLPGSDPATVERRTAAAAEPAG